MKTLIALILVSVGLGAAYWKTQYPNATLDDIKLGATNTVERAKTGFNAFREGSPTGAQSLASTGSGIDTAIDDRLGALETSVDTRIGALEELLNRPGADSDTAQNLTLTNARIADTERRLNVSEKKFSQVNESIELLAEQIDTVSGSLGNLNDGAAATLNDRKTILDSIEVLDERVDSLKAAMGEQDAEQTLTNIGTRIDAMDTRIGQLSSSSSKTVEELSVQIAGLDDRANSLDARINTLSVESTKANDDAAEGGNLRVEIDKRLQQLETKLATSNTDSKRVESLKTRLDSTEQTLASLQDSTSTAAAALATNTDNTADYEARVSALLEQLADNATRTAGLEDQLSAATKQLAVLTKELEVVKLQAQSSDSVEALQAELNTQLASLTARIDNASGGTEISNLTQTLTTTRERIQSLEALVQELPSDRGENNSVQLAQSELQAEIAAAETRLREMIANTKPEFLNTLSQVQQQVAELRSRNASSGGPAGSTTNKYTVYFGPGKTAISDEGAEELRSFIREEKGRTLGVSIYGFTDRSGDAFYNQQLALQRATSVRRFLITNGFDFTKIRSLSGLGEEAAAATLEDGVAAADQRAVVLVSEQP